MDKTMKNCEIPNKNHGKLVKDEKKCEIPIRNHKKGMKKKKKNREIPIE